MGAAAPRASGGSGCAVGAIVAVVVGLFLLLFGGGFVAFFLARRTSVAPPVPIAVSGAPVPIATALPSSSRMQWQGTGGAILTDVNGDGTPDVVGRVRYVASGDHVSIGAFDGATGAPIWESAPLGTYSDTHQGTLGLAEDTLVLSFGGTTSGWSTHDGKLRWRGTLPDRAKQLCRGDHAGEVRVELVDATTSVVRLADGHAAAPVPTPKTGDRCARLASDAQGGDPGYVVHDALLDPLAAPKVDGMLVRSLLVRPGSPEIALGWRAKGTRVPMIAGIAPDPMRSWKSDVPGADPLDALAGPEAVGTVSATRACTEYGASAGTKAHVLTCFDLAGHRLWETPLSVEMPFGAIQSTEHRIFVSQWTRLSVFDAATGKPVFSIGGPG